MSEESDLLRSEILAHRNCGRLTYVVESRRFEIDNPKVEPLPIIDKFVGRNGYEGLGQGWHEVNQRQARLILQQILHKDLAYQGKIMGAGTAEEFAHRFLSQFGEKSRYFTNNDFADEGPFRQWTPLTKATFDAGVVCLGSKLIGMIWVEDED
jgi:hypothetical protein